MAAGCLEQGTRPAGDLRSVVESHIGAYLALDIETILSLEHDPWVDLGGGSCPNGARSASSPPQGTENETPSPAGPDASCDPANVTHDERRAMLLEGAEREGFRAAVEGKRVEDLFDMTAMTDEDAVALLAERSTQTPFRAQPGDRAVHVPPREGSPFFDGWFRIYGERDGRLVSVAGD